MGFIAQEAEKVIPEVVSKANNHYAMQYAPVTALLVEAVKTQQKQIEALTQELKQKSSDIDNLKAEVEELKTIVEQSAKK
jgi:predicted RNase H-like nuclease (RuvC/YqgF family)